MPRKKRVETQMPLSEMAGEAPLRRELPQDIEAEQGLLGSILLDPVRVLDICSTKGVVVEAFVDPIHRSIYAAITRLASKGQPVDGITVSNFLKGTDDQNAVGGLRSLTELIERTPTSAHASYYAELVMEQYLRRCILGAVREVEINVYNALQSAAYVLGMAEQIILGIGEGRVKRGSSVDWRTSVGETLSILKRQLEHPGELSGIPTGFKALDNQLRGLHKGEMIVLAARPSMGKTSLAMNIAECVARGRNIIGVPLPSEDGRVKKRTVLVFSLEMPQQQLVTRMLCGMAGIPAREIERGFLKRDEVYEKLASSANELCNMPILCDDQGGLDVMELRARARHAHKRTPVELIVIDYLQLLSYREYAQQGQQIMVAKISGEIKAMAKELNVPVIVLSQLSRNPEQRGGDEKPRNSDLRDSGAIEQDADVIMLLRRPCFMGSKVPGHDNPKLAIVDISKNRNGPTGEVILDFDGKLTRFSDPANLYTRGDADDEPVDPSFS